MKISDKKIRAMPFPILSFTNCVTQRAIDNKARIILNNLLNIYYCFLCKIKKTFVNELISFIVYLAKFILDEKNVSAVK